MQPLSIQGVAQADAVVNNTAFFAATSAVRKPISNAQNRTWAGLGSVDTVTIPKVGLCGNLYVTVEGEVVVPATPTVRPLWNWPLDIARFQLSANGVTNLIDAPGSWLKAREIIADPFTSDRGISRTLAGTARTNGTLATSESDVWPFGPNAAWTTAGTYVFRMTFKIPTCLEDQFSTGLLYAQTTGTNIQLDIRWAGVADMFEPTGTQVTFQNVTFSVEQDTFSIPTMQTDKGSALVLPELGVFHIFRYNNDLITANGATEYRLAAVGPGKQLNRVIGRIRNNTLAYGGAMVTPTPIQLINPAGASRAAQVNYDRIALLYGTNDEIRAFTGVQLLTENEKNYGSAIGLYHGFWCIDLMDKSNPLRDTRDEGQAADLRLSLAPSTNVTIAQPARVEYVVEESMTAAA